eukprot:95762-Chlamydomonas_euryale.AAC.1
MHLDGALRNDYGHAGAMASGGNGGAWKTAVAYTKARATTTLKTRGSDKTRMLAWPKPQTPACTHRVG